MTLADHPDLATTAPDRAWASRTGKQVFIAGCHAADARDELVAELVVEALNDSVARRMAEVGAAAVVRLAGGDHSAGDTM